MMNVRRLTKNILNIAQKSKMKNNLMMETTDHIVKLHISEEDISNGCLSETNKN